MYSSAFDYHAARSLSDAQQLLAAHPGAKLLAGGHSLIPLLKLRLAAPPAVIDIGRIAELRGITTSGDLLRIGALTTHAELSRSADVDRVAHALAEAAAIVGDPAVRNRGTIGGNVAHADPASDLPTVLVGLEARMVAIGPRATRTIPAAAFFTGIMAHRSRRRRDSRGDRDSGFARRREFRLRQVRSSRVALRRGRRGRESAALGWNVHGHQRGHWRTGVARTALAVGRACAARPADHTGHAQRRCEPRRRRSRRRRQRRYLRVGWVPGGDGAGLRQARARRRRRAGHGLTRLAGLKARATCVKLL